MNTNATTPTAGPTKTFDRQFWKYLFAEQRLRSLLADTDRHRPEAWDAVREALEFGESMATRWEQGRKEAQA